MMSRTRRCWPLEAVVLVSAMSLGAVAHAEEAPSAPPAAAAAEAEAEAAPVTPAASVEAAPVTPAASVEAAPVTPAASVEAAPATSPETAGEQPGRRAPVVPEWLERLGRVESVLIANEDPESALEFAQELIGRPEGQARLRLLLGACHMQLGQAEQALEQFNQAVTLSTSADETETQMQALFNVARAFHAASQFTQAAQAYDRYVTFARTHSELPTFVEEAQRLSRALQARAEVETRRR